MASILFWPICVKGGNMNSGVGNKIFQDVINSWRARDAYTYTSVNKAIVGSGNGLLPVRRQAIWTNAEVLSITP